MRIAATATTSTGAFRSTCQYNNNKHLKAHREHHIRSSLATVCVFFYFARNDHLKFKFFFGFFFLLSSRENENECCGHFLTEMLRSQKKTAKSEILNIFFVFAVSLHSYARLHFLPCTLLASFTDARTVKSSCYFNAQSQFPRISTEIALSWSSNETTK